MLGVIKTMLEFIGTRIDLIVKFIAISFTISIFANYLYDNYTVNILDYKDLLPDTIQIFLYKLEFTLYWIIPFFFSIVFLIFTILMTVTCIIKIALKQLSKNIENKDSIKSANFLKTITSFFRFLVLQTIRLGIGVILLGFLLVGVYYVLATLNHIGSLIPSKLYTSSFETIDPLKNIFSFSHLFHLSTHKEWVQNSIILYKCFLIILYLFWFYINPYQIDIEHWAKVKSEKKLIKHK